MGSEMCIRDSSQIQCTQRLLVRILCQIAKGGFKIWLNGKYFIHVAAKLSQRRFAIIKLKCHAAAIGIRHIPTRNQRRAASTNLSQRFSQLRQATKDTDNQLVGIQIGIQR